jgi:hypothetical protein
MLTVLYCVLAALTGAAPAAFISYKIAYRKGKVYGCRYTLRYGPSIIRARNNPPA